MYLKSPKAIPNEVMFFLSHYDNELYYDILDTVEKFIHIKYPSRLRKKWLVTGINIKDIGITSYYVSNQNLDDDDGFSHLISEEDVNYVKLMFPNEKLKFFNLDELIYNYLWKNDLLDKIER